jgi:hypothetical protein
MSSLSLFVLVGTVRPRGRRASGDPQNVLQFANASALVTRGQAMSSRMRWAPSSIQLAWRRRTEKPHRQNGQTDFDSRGTQ